MEIIAVIAIIGAAFAGASRMGKGSINNGQASVDEAAARGIDRPFAGLWQSGKFINGTLRGVPTPQFHIVDKFQHWSNQH